MNTKIERMTDKEFKRIMNSVLIPSLIGVGLTIHVSLLFLLSLVEFVMYSWILLSISPLFAIAYLLTKKPIKRLQLENDIDTSTRA